MIIRMGIGNNGEEYVIKTVELDLSNMDAVSSQLGLLCFVYSGFTPSHLFFLASLASIWHPQKGLTVL